MIEIVIICCICCFFFRLVSKEKKHVYLIVHNDAILLRWRKICLKHIAINQIAAITIKSVRDYISLATQRDANDYLLGGLSFHSVMHPYSLNMYKTASCFIGEHYHEALICTVLKSEELKEIMAVTKVPIYVTAEFFHNCHPNVKTLLSILDSRIHICDNERVDDWLSEAMLQEQNK